MLALVFPGQGSQKRGMGQRLFDEVREYSQVEKEVDALVGYSMRGLCLEDPENRLKNTRYTQPSLYIVNALYYYQGLREGMRPAYLAGHSVGEYNALLAAGVFDLLTGLRLVQVRAELMSRATNGGMAAIVGFGAERITQILRHSGLNMLDVANFNAPSQVVISGPLDEINRAGPIIERAGAQAYVPLLVSGAFHSRYMERAALEFAQFLSGYSFAPPRLPVIANANAEPYPLHNASEGIKSLLAKQITSPVRWTQTVRWLMANGVKELKEMGPGNVLTRLIQQIQQAR